MPTEQKTNTILFLLNDTDPILMRVIKNKFQKEAEWDCIISTKYDDAVSLFLQEKPDVILTEIIIDDEKGRNGFDFIAEVKNKEIAKKVQIIIFTDLAQDEDRAKAEKLGVRYFFVKSKISVNQLIGEIQNNILTD